MHPTRLWQAFIIACSLAVLVACSSNPADDSQYNAAQLYAQAARAMRNAEWDEAIKALRRVQARYPFDPYALQAHLDLIYVQNEKLDPEAVVDEADRFVKENPRHPRVDYAYYMRGVAYFPRPQFFLSDWFDIDQAWSDASGAQRSFNYFKRLVESYPQSQYAPDARARMVFLQDLMARHELHVAKWYMRRGAFIAAAARARGLLADYPQSVSQPEALELLVAAYRKLGLKDLAGDAQKVLDANFPGRKPTLEYEPLNERWLDWMKRFFT